MADRTPPEIEAKVLALYQQGHSLQACAEPFGLYKATVKNIAIRAGVFVPRRHLPRDEIAADYQAGVAVRDILTKYRLDHDGLRRVIISKGLSYRSRSQARRRQAINEFVFSSITDDSAYWLGFLLADGCVYSRDWGHDTNSLYVNLAAKDRGHLEAFGRFLGTTVGVRDLPVSGSRPHPQATIRVSSKQLVADIVRFGVTPGKTWTAEVHQSLQGNVHFWRGMVDGDGSLYWHQFPTGRQRMPGLMLCGTKAVCEGLSRFVATAVLPGRLKAATKKLNIWYVRYSGSEAAAVAAALYDQATTALPRKVALARAFTEYAPRLPAAARLTKEHLLAVRPKYPTWRAVASAEQVPYGTLRRVLRRHGLSGVLRGGGGRLGETARRAARSGAGSP